VTLWHTECRLEAYFADGVNTGSFWLLAAASGFRRGGPQWVPVRLVPTGHMLP